MIETVKGKDLKLGDVINMGWEDGYSSATVKKINEDGTVQLFRPFVYAAEYATTSGVPVYIGIEEFFIWPNTEVKRVRKGRVD